MKGVETRANNSMQRTGDSLPLRQRQEIQAVLRSELSSVFFAMT